ncbi:hypothetical protein [Aquirufa sp.]|jgi:hypothetical protein|uniref:hypothetical protein n=1 Tax=Aquirufa sp. TaxID=2676249 RepID=UPI00378373D7
MKNFKALLIIPFFFYATEGYLKAFKIGGTSLMVKILVSINFLICVGLAMSDFQFFGNSDLDGFYTQMALAEFIYLVFGFGLHLFAGLEENE